MTCPLRSLYRRAEASVTCRFCAAPEVTAYGRIEGMLNSKRSQVERWYTLSRRVFSTAELAFADGDWRSAASRAYYAAYQAATGVCVAHGDAVKFPPQWNNPSHDQLPDLIRNNGDLPVFERRRISQSLVSLRSSREDSDYRLGVTVEKPDALKCLQQTANILRLLGVLTDGQD